MIDKSITKKIPLKNYYHLCITSIKFSEAGIAVTQSLFDSLHNFKNYSKTIRDD